MFRSFATVVAVSVLSGCASPAVEEDIVTGIVTYGDEPVWEGHLVLVGEGRLSVADLQPDGSFAMVNPPLGTVQVAVSNHPKGPAPSDPVVTGLPGQAECIIPPRVSFELPRRFADPEKSGLTVEIRRGRQQVSLPLPLQSDDPPPVRKPGRVLGSAIGDEAPEIYGDDLEGHALSLSDYRGKVVLLVFWAHWCSLCREQFGHYHEIVERMSDRPFVLLGVNCDPEREFIERQKIPHGINWRSWWDGAAVGGPVTTAWRLEGLPGVILIDHEGVVRRRSLRGVDLDDAIEELIRAVPTDSNRS